MKFLKYLFFVSIIITTLNLAAEEKMVIRFNQPDEQIVKEFRNLEYDIATFRPREYLDIVVTETEYNSIIARGFNVTITQTESQLKENLRSGRELDGYMTNQEVNDQLIVYSYLYPEICELYVLGDSWGKIYYEEGNDNYLDYDHEILGLKVSDNVSIEEDEPNLYYFGAHHAREPISTEVTMYVLEHILSNYATDPDITDDVDAAQLWFIPMVNPNGHHLVINEVDVWWRKNIRDNNDNGVLDEEDYGDYIDGVDLNRNYAHEWGLVGASDLWENQLYHGPEPLSEPETQIIETLFDSHHFVAGISYHSHGELVLFPYGYNENVTAPDHDALEELAVAMAEQIPSINYGHYTPEEAWILYPAQGVLDDYAYGVKGIFGYTIELATEFIPPASEVIQIREDNLQAALTMLDRPSHSILTGHITDSSTSLPMVAEIYIEGIDNTGVFRHPYVSNETFGTYYRLLTDGIYDVTFSRYGYESETYNGVEINSAGQTFLDVTLEPSPITSLIGAVYDQIGAPIPEARIEVLNTPLEVIYTNDNGEYSIPEIAIGTYQVRVTAPGYTSIQQEIVLTEEVNEIYFILFESEAESFEYPEFNEMWQLSGDAEWFIDDSEAYEGLFSARSGPIGANQSTSLSIDLNVVETGEIRFYKKVSCEDDQYDHDYDFMTFNIDGIEEDRWDGENDWSEHSYPVTPGFHTFSWVYEKDGYVSEGSDCAWIDLVFLPEFDNTSSSDTEIPSGIELLENYPNPFNPTTKISFQVSGVSSQEDVELAIYNIKGQKVKTFTFLNGSLGTSDDQTNALTHQLTNSYQVTWNGTDDDNQPVSSGIYFYKLRAGDFKAVKKMLLMK